MTELVKSSKTLLQVALCCLMCCTLEAKTSVTKQTFGKMPDGTPVEIFTLAEGAVEARIIT